MKRSDRRGRVEDAVLKCRARSRWLERIGRIAARIGWRRSIPGRIELRQSVKGLIGIPVLRPVLAKCAEVVIERAVLLSQENNVIDWHLIEIRRHGGAVVDCNDTAADTGAGPAPTPENGARLGRGGERHLGPVRERIAACCAALNTGRTTGHRAGCVAGV